MVTASRRWDFYIEKIATITEGHEKRPKKLSRCSELTNEVTQYGN